MKQLEVFSQRLLNITFYITCCIVFVIVAIRSAIIPFSQDEAATFFNYIQQGQFLPYHSYPDANNHILNSFLSWICFNLFGDSPFALRLPNLLAVIILIITVARISKSLTQTHSKLLLLSGFLLSFHWLSFYSVCRGYGLSMSFLLLSVSYLLEYFNSKDISKLILTYLFIQIAISASLILVIISLVLTFAIVVFQFCQNKLFEKWNILTLLIHISCLIYWIKFSLFLQSINALYLGWGENYWKAYISLMELLIGNSSIWGAFLVLCIFIILAIASLIGNFNKLKNNFQFVFTPSLFYPLILICLIIVFYAMHTFLKVNYPRDRTGLFFYLFFILSVTFVLDKFKFYGIKIFATILTLGILIHFIINVNFRKHSFNGYFTIPERFYARLLQEQQSSSQRITVGGIEEHMYAFGNYRYNGALNLLDCDFHTNLYLNSDFAITWEQNKKFYMPYYSVIDSEKDWNILLMKRKEKAKRNLLITVDSLKSEHGSKEFYSLYNAMDTCFKNLNPLLIEFNLASIQNKMPINSWLILQIDTSEGHPLYYKRIPLNWIRYDWSNSRNQRLDLISGPLPVKIHNFSCYIWNATKQEINLKINSIRIYQLEGDRVNVVVSSPY